jgi:hypothetical protein
MKTWLALMLLMGELAIVVTAADSVPPMIPAVTPSEPTSARPRAGTGLPVVGLREIYLSAWEEAGWLETNRTGIDESDFLPWPGRKGHAVGGARSPGASGGGSESSSSGARPLLSVVNPQDSETEPGQACSRPTGSRPVLPGVSSGQSQTPEPPAAFSQQVLVLSNRIVELHARLDELERKMKEIPQPRGGSGKSRPVPRTAGEVPPKH